MISSGINLSAFSCCFGADSANSDALQGNNKQSHLDHTSSQYWDFGHLHLRWMVAFIATSDKARKHSDPTRVHEIEALIERTKVDWFNPADFFSQDAQRTRAAWATGNGVS